MTSTILLLGPLTLIVGCLYWVLSLGKEQAALNAELWPRLRKEARPATPSTLQSN